MSTMKHLQMLLLVILRSTQAPVDKREEKNKSYAFPSSLLLLQRYEVIWSKTIHI